MRIAAAQISVKPGDVQENTSKMLNFLKEAAQDGADLAVFPELSDTGYDIPLVVTTAQSWDQGTVPQLRNAAHELGINVVAGVSERTAEGVYNTTVILDRTGAITGRYRKTHLITAAPMLEHNYLKAGDCLVSAVIDGVMCGFMTCYDIRFPEIARSLTLDGVKILFIPAAFPLVRLPHWTTLIAARAIENQVFVVACNRIGTDAGVTFCGTTMIIDPYGTIAASGSDIHESLVTCNIDLTMIDTVRSQIKVHQDRRPDLYRVGSID